MSEFLHFLQGEMDVPGIFSWFHFVMLIPIIGLTIFISVFFKNSSEKVYKRILFIFWIILIILEIFKQILKAFHYGNPSYWEYSIRDFPFSICSMIYYLIPIILWVNKDKHPKIIDAVNGYLCFISLFVALIVCVYTNMIMSRLIYTNVQSLLHHGSQVVLGVYIFVWNRNNITIKTTYRSLILFAITAAMAIIVNLCFYPHFINMFFINPRRITNLPVGSFIQEKLGYPIYLILFLISISILTYLTYFIETGIYTLIKKKRHRN